MTYKHRNFSFHKSSGDEIHACSSAYVTHSRGSAPPLQTWRATTWKHASSVSALCILHLTLWHYHLHTAASELHLFCPLSSLISQNLVTFPPLNFPVVPFWKWDTFLLAPVQITCFCVCAFKVSGSCARTISWDSLRRGLFFTIFSLTSWNKLPVTTRAISE